MASERKDKEEKRMLERRQDTQPAEKWKPFEQYDKFRQPGFWRGDDEEIKRNPALPSPKRNLDRRSFLQAPEAIPLEAAIERVAMEGRYGDTELAHVNPEEKMLLAMNGGAGTVNPSTGAMEFYQDNPAEPATDTDQPKAEQAAGVSKFAVKELKALRDMIRDAKRSGKSEDKKTLKEITKRHKKLLENLMSDNPTTDDVKSVPLDVAVKRVAMEGRGGDTMVAHIMPEEAKLLKELGGSGAINPSTGLREFDAMGTGSYGNDTGGNDFGGSSPGGNDTPSTPSDGLDSPDNSLYDTYADFTGDNTPVSSGAFGDSLISSFTTTVNPNIPTPPPVSQQVTTPVTQNWGDWGRDQFGALGQNIGRKMDNFEANPFGTIAGFLGGMAVSSIAGPLAGNLLGGGIAGAIGGRVAGAAAGSVASNAISNAVGNATSPNASAPTTTAQATSPITSDYDIKSNENLGTSPLNFDSRLAPLTSAAVTPLAVQPTTTVADGNTTNNPFLSGIYIPPIGAPTAGRPLAINT